LVSLKIHSAWKKEKRKERKKGKKERKRKERKKKEREEKKIEIMYVRVITAPAKPLPPSRRTPLPPADR
jgi:hypothetical protein